jgi:hypothetical protein
MYGFLLAPAYTAYNELVQLVSYAAQNSVVGRCVAALGHAFVQERTLGAGFTEFEPTWNRDVRLPACLFIEE